MNLRWFRFACTALLAVSFGAVVVCAQTSRPSAPPEARQFDFWLGEWDVASPDGRPQGTNKIEQVSDGRGLLENWSGDSAAGNGSGKSLSAWNAEKKRWQQFWIGADGGVLELSGNLANGSMVLTGEHLADGREVAERITWTPKADGSVRQLWEKSFDRGGTWATVFDGRYVKRRPKIAGGLNPVRAMFYLFL